MDRSQIETYFAHLSAVPAARDVVGEIVLFDGAAMVLAHKARLSTKDVDAVFEPKTRFAIEELCQNLEGL